MLSCWAASACSLHSSSSCSTCRRSWTLVASKAEYRVTSSSALRCNPWTARKTKNQNQILSTPGSYMKPMLFFSPNQCSILLPGHMTHRLSHPLNIEKSQRHSSQSQKHHHPAREKKKRSLLTPSSIFFYRYTYIALSSLFICYFFFSICYDIATSISSSFSLNQLPSKNCSFTFATLWFRLAAHYSIFFSFRGECWTQLGQNTKSGSIHTHTHTHRRRGKQFFFFCFLFLGGHKALDV